LLNEKEKQGYIFLFRFLKKKAISLLGNKGSFIISISKYISFPKLKVSNFWLYVTTMLSHILVISCHMYLYNIVTTLHNILVYIYSYNIIIMCYNMIWYYILIILCTTNILVYFLYNSLKKILLSYSISFDRIHFNYSKLC
jgi:hypothetical protein